MKVALTAWEDRISPVFDSARTLLIAKIKNGEIGSRRYEPFVPEISFRLGERLKNLGIDVLICGAILQIPAGIIESSGIQLIPFINGRIEDVLASYATGMPLVPAFSMPGCGRRHGQTRGRMAFLNRQKEVSGMPRGDKAGPQGDGAGSGKGRGGCKGGDDPAPGPGQGQGQGQGRGQGQGKGKGQGQGRGQGQGKGKGQGDGQGPRK